MKSFVLVLNGEESNARFVSNSNFDASDIKPIWCEYDIGLVEKNKDMTSHIVIFLPELFTNDFLKLLFYVRDLCIDEEKILYLYGSKSAIDNAHAIIPSIFIATKCDSSESTISDFVNLICRQIRDLSNPQKTILMLNDGTDYFKELSLMLRTDFDVILSKLNMEDIFRYINMADIILISVDTRMSVLENGLIFDKIEEYQRKGRLKLIFVANDSEQQTKINVIKARSIICLSKATEIQKVANYLRKRYL